MSSSPAAPSLKPERYHHGDLRNALLSAAKDLAGEVGVDGFTLREVARRAGVSHAAPYHHFSDKAALLRALAADAFARLTAAMNLASQRSPQPLEQLDEIGIAYVEFALTHAVEFRFMFRRELCLSDEQKRAGETDTLEHESLKSRAILERTILAAQAQGLLGGDPELALYSGWSAVHGLAMLLLDAPGFEHLKLETARDMARGVLQTLRYGIETRARPKKNRV